MSSDRTLRTIHWFRKGLRLHDNPALLHAVEHSHSIWPVFILDPWFVKNYKVGPNRWRFLAQSLEDLDGSFRKLNGRLYVVRGKPQDVFPKLFKDWNINCLTFEVDTEPYAQDRDAEIKQLAEKFKVKVVTKVSHTLYDTEKVLASNGGKPPLTYQKMTSLMNKLGPPAKPVAAITQESAKGVDFSAHDDECFSVPTLEELGVSPSALGACLYPGGETEALKRLDMNLKKTNWVCTFEKPKTEPNTLNPSTTVLSPYLKFGCMSPRLFYWKLKEICTKFKKHSQPPVSLEGQLLWREFFYSAGLGTPNFNRMQGNPVCRQIPWKDNPEFFEAWKNAQTGFPFIDAIMTQLKQEGWIHHLARHAVACFLTRGDLWVSWEKGQEVFEELLLDADWYLNAGNWMWLSASAFFHQYYRVYSPIAFGKKTDKTGQYIKKYLPKLKKYPEKYIYEPWTAPKSVQEAAGCVIGQDYPKPIVDHDKAREENLKRMKAAYGQGGNETDKEPMKTMMKRKTQESHKNQTRKIPRK